MDIAGINAEGMFPRASLKELWDNPQNQPDWPYPISEIPQQSWVPDQHLTKYGGISSIVGPEYQYIIHEKFGEELYNFMIDSDETNNLIKDKDVQDTLSNIRNEIKDVTR
jgi:hypothetical protein